MFLVVHMFATWPGGWGWAWTGWPAETGSSPPCLAAAPASWRLTPGPDNDSDNDDDSDYWLWRGVMSLCNVGIITWTKCCSGASRRAPQTQVSQIEGAEKAEIVSRWWQGNEGLLVTWVITGVWTDTIIVKRSSWWKTHNIYNDFLTNCLWTLPVVRSPSCWLAATGSRPLPQASD